MTYSIWVEMQRHAKWSQKLSAASVLCQRRVSIFPRGVEVIINKRSSKDNQPTLFFIARWDTDLQGDLEYNMRRTQVLNAYRCHCCFSPGPRH